MVWDRGGVGKGPVLLWDPRAQNRYWLYGHVGQLRLAPDGVGPAGWEQTRPAASSKDGRHQVGQAQGTLAGGLQAGKGQSRPTQERPCRPPRGTQSVTWAAQVGARHTLDTADSQAAVFAVTQGSGSEWAMPSQAGAQLWVQTQPPHAVWRWSRSPSLQSGKMRPPWCRGVLHVRW